MIEDTGINRNIMECKDIAVWCRDFGYDVLIETLWNVKRTEITLSASSIGINRNIMECKVVCS